MMNPGYLSFIVLAMVAVLIATGWKGTFAGNAGRLPLLLVPALWFAGLFVDFRSGSSLQWNGGIAVLIGASVWALLRLVRVRRAHQVLWCVASALAIGAFHLGLQHLFVSEPDLLRIHPRLALASSAALVAVAFHHRASGQFAALTFGLLTGDFLFQSMSGFSPIRLGGMAFYDLWWVSLMGARCLSAAVSRVAKGWRMVRRKTASDES